MSYFVSYFVHGARRRDQAAWRRPGGAALSIVTAALTNLFRELRYLRFPMAIDFVLPDTSDRSKA
jgi:hypothetical protein